MVCTRPYGPATIPPMTAIALPIDALIQRDLPAARGGDAVAYGRIVSACQNTVTAVALAITRDEGASEDIAQEAFFNAWQRLDSLHSPDSFLPWLRQIARNLARDHLRRYRDQPLDGANAELVLAVAADPGPQPMQHVLDGEREVAAAELIASLPEDSRETLLLFYREGQSSQQVASLLGITDAAVRKRLSRARQQIRDDLLARFGEFARNSAPSAAFTAAVITGLGIATKPGAAMAATTLGAGAVGGGIASKGLMGMLGMGGLVGGSLAGGWLAAHLTRRYILTYAETLDERDAILAAYHRYLRWTMLWMAIAFAAALSGYSLLLTTLVTVVAEAISLRTLLAIRCTLLPLIVRDRARDPEGANARYRAYNYSYGPVAIFWSGLIYVLSMPLFHISLHYGSEGVAIGLQALWRVLS
jgi:RNA polymerase sigma factor (sigma-70 family)